MFNAIVDIVKLIMVSISLCMVLRIFSSPQMLEAEALLNVLMHIVHVHHAETISFAFLNLI